MTADDASTVMRHQPPRRTRAHLDGLIAGRPTSPDPLAGLLAAASAPAQQGELAGSDSAVAAFAAAPFGTTSVQQEPPMFRGIPGRTVAVKLVAVAAGVAATGGAAFAAVSSNDTAPRAHSAIADSTSGTPTGSVSFVGGPRGTSTNDQLSAAPQSESSSSAPSANSTPSPSLVGLCTAWLAHSRDLAKVSSNPAFSVLIRKAGDTDAVDGYCTTLVASARPSPPAHPTQAPNTKPHPGPSTHPSPPAHPTQAHNTKPHPEPSATAAPSAD